MEFSEAITLLRNDCTGIGPYPSGTTWPAPATAVQSIVALIRGINRNANDVLQYRNNPLLSTYNNRLNWLTTSAEAQSVFSYVEIKLHALICKIIHTVAEAPCKVGDTPA